MCLHTVFIGPLSSLELLAVLSISKDVNNKCKDPEVEAFSVTKEL